MTIASESLTNSISLKDISYPVFKIGDIKPSDHNGVKLILYEKWEEDEEENLIESNVVKILDDTSLPGNLARRRLAIMLTGVKLVPLRKAFFFLGDLIKASLTTTWYIDANGKIFQYKKTTRARLKWYKVDKLFRIPSGGVIVSIVGLNSRFKALFAPSIPLQDLHVAILEIGMSLILYGFYDKKYEQTWRKV